MDYQEDWQGDEKSEADSEIEIDSVVKQFHIE